MGFRGLDLLNDIKKFNCFNPKLRFETNLRFITSLVFINDECIFLLEKRVNPVPFLKNRSTVLQLGIVYINIVTTS